MRVAAPPTVTAPLSVTCRPASTRSDPCPPPTPATEIGSPVVTLASNDKAPPSSTEVVPKFEPNAAAHATYTELYGLYRELHDAFGGVRRQGAADLGTIMKRLLDLKERA